MSKSLPANNNKIYQFFLYLIIGIGIALRLTQYFYNRSLWLDEASLATSIINPSISLLDPLPNQQVAPILFLYIERFLVLLFNSSELVLRFFPLIISIVSIPLAFYLFRNLTNDSKISLLALSVFCLSPLLIYYSSELKQYIIDVFVSILLINITLSNINQKTKYLYLLIIGSVSIYLSNITPLVLFTIGIYCFLRKLKEKKIDYPILFIGFVWIIIFAKYYMDFIYNHPTHDYMVEFWGKCFMPINPFKQEFWIFFIKKVGVFLKQIFFKPSSFIYIIVIPAIFLLGILKVLWGKNSEIKFFIFFPIVLHLVLSSLKIYPFHMRLVLYLTPYFILIFIYGFDSIYDFFKNKIHIQFAKLFLISFFTILIIGNSFVFPFKRIEARPVLNHVKNKIKHDQLLFIYWDIESIYNYYTAINYFDFSENNVEFGKYFKDPVNYVDDISMLEGEIWFVFSDIGSLKIETVLNYLNSKAELLDKVEGDRVFAYLYRM